jgi:hypothetical protein
LDARKNSENTTASGKSVLTIQVPKEIICYDSEIIRLEAQEILTVQEQVECEEQTFPPTQQQVIEDRTARVVNAGSSSG